MLSRRDFLKRGVVVVSAGIALPPVFAKAVHAAANDGGQDPATKKRTLVVVQMAGGNDGLNTVVPYADGRYYDVRPGIGIAADSVVPLTDRAGLHPSLAKLGELWGEGRLAVVQGVGYPNPNFSHFRSMEIWQTANPDQYMGDGWLGRYFDRVIDEQGHVLDGVAVGNLLPLAMRSGGSEVGVIQSLDIYRLQGDPRRPEETDARVNALLNLYSSYPTKAPYAALLDDVADAAHRSSEEIQRAAAAYLPAVEYPKTPIGNGFQILAQIICQELGVRVCHIGMGGFDTHTYQPAQQARLLKDTAEGLHAFYRDLEAHGKDGDVLIMTWSEFGRRVQENANSGTDHGTALPLFLLGGQVQAGLYGEAPSLHGLDDGNLRFTTDFRSVYASILEGWLGAPADDVLGQRYERLPFMAAATNTQLSGRRPS